MKKFWVVILLFTMLFSTIENVIGEKQNQHSKSWAKEAQDSMYLNPTFSYKILQKAMAQANDSLEYYEIFALYSQIYVFNNQFEEGMKLIDKLDCFCKQQTPSPLVHKLLAMVNNARGIYAAYMSKADLASDYYFLAFEHAQKGDNAQTLPNICISIADLQLKKGDYANAAFYFRKSLVLSDSLQMTADLGFPIYLGLGQTYMELRDFVLADEFYMRAQVQLEKRDLGEQFLFCSSRGNYYYFKEDYPDALTWFFKAKNKVAGHNLEFYEQLCNANIGEVYLFMNKPDSASFYLNKSYDYFRKIDNQSILFHLATLKASVAMEHNNASLAWSLLKSNSNENGIEPSLLLLRRKNLQRFFEKTGNYKEAYKAQSQYVKYNDSLRADRVLKRVAELDMRYKLDTTLIRRDSYIAQQKSEMDSLYKSIWIWILLCSVLAFMLLFIYLYMAKKRKLDWHKHVEQITRLRLTNTRNRVSPHFIFNAISRSIDQRRDDSLTDLVQLLRQSLEITNHLVITLEQELEFVRLYLNIEQKTMGNDFILNWEQDESLDCTRIKIPTMMIQIPVENAIKHALRSIEGKKILTLRVESLQSGTGITIQDNGPGYMSREAKSTAGTKNGLQIIYQTIALLNSRNKEKISFSITDMRETEGIGTTVYLFIPSAYSYIFET